MHLLHFLFPAAMALSIGCAASAPDKAAIDADPSSEEAPLSVRLPPTHAGERHLVDFDGTTKWQGLSFHGAAGARVSIYAAARKGDVDTVAYLYKVSKTTGRTFGRALAVDDDTTRSDWTTTPTNSSIDAFTLPEARDYAILVRAFDARQRGLAEVWYLEDVDPAHGVAAFPGVGPRTAIASFSGVVAEELSISGDVLALQDKATANGWVLVPARVHVEPAALHAIVADPARLGTFGYDTMYYAGARPFGSSYAGYHGPAALTEIRRADAIATLAKATTDPSDPASGEPMRELEQQMIESMLADGSFATERVRIYQAHWDNADDTNAEAVLAIDLSTGEARAITYVNPP